MSKIAFVACSKTKLDHTATAAALYSSALFRKSLLAALDSHDQVYILSAKHGILDLGQCTAPYNVTLKTMDMAERLAWADMVAPQMEDKVKNGDIVDLYCGQDYIKPIMPIMLAHGYKMHEPLADLSIGARLQRLRSINEELVIEEMMNRFKILLKKLWRHQKGGIQIANCSGKTELPNRGIYFILDHQKSAKTMPRIVRVGTHAVSHGAKTSLWNRLSTHRGTLDGRGSHRSSIFRSHVGRAIMKKNPKTSWPTTWSVGQQAPAEIREQEVLLEREVSRHIGALGVLWLNVPDEPHANSDRAYIERGVIGLLSRFGLLTPNTHGNWLGSYSHDWRIAASGIWNLDHIFSFPDPHLLDVLEKYVNVTIGETDSPDTSIAPKNWRDKKMSHRAQPQLSFFN